MKPLHKRIRESFFRLTEDAHESARGRRRAIAITLGMMALGGATVGVSFQAQEWLQSGGVSLFALRNVKHSTFQDVPAVHDVGPGFLTAALSEAVARPSETPLAALKLRLPRDFQENLAAAPQTLAAPLVVVGKDGSTALYAREGLVATAYVLPSEQILIQEKARQLGFSVTNVAPEGFGWSPALQFAVTAATVVCGALALVAGLAGVVAVLASLALLVLSIVNKSKLQPLRQAFGAPTEVEVVSHAGSSWPMLEHVRGIDEVREEVMRSISFLRDPSRFAACGARMPRGVLLHGAPGCGKTLLARAIANEAGVAFFQMSGADFRRKWFGDGSRLIRDTFAKVRASGRGVLFIDEIDAVASRRSSDEQSAAREANATLNSLLVEMDGFAAHEGVLVIGATNLPENLDPAILRPGRFDSVVAIPLPDVKGRQEILEVHARNKPLAEEVSLPQLARCSAGFSGAMLEGLLNEAAIRAVCAGEKFITAAHLEESFKRVSMGVARRSALSAPEKRICAYHEIGHALACIRRMPSVRLESVSVIPRGASLGHTMFTPKFDTFLKSREQYYSEIVVLLGGRAAEEVFCGTVTSGAGDDLRRARELAEDMVLKLGMGPRTGLFARGGSAPLGEGHVAPAHASVLLSESPHAANASGQGGRHSDAEVSEIREILAYCYQQAVTLMRSEKIGIDRAADELLIEETLGGDDVAALLKWNPLEESDRVSSKESTPGSSRPRQTVPQGSVAVAAPRAEEN